MGGLEICFMLSALVYLVIWGRFVWLGFQTSHFWGTMLLLFFPISPFVFAYRFERKTRKLIYYFIASLVLFSGMTVYALNTRAAFFKTLATQWSNLLPDIHVADLISDKKQPLIAENPSPIKPVVIDEPKVYTPKPEVIAPEKPKPESKQKLHGYQIVSVDSLSRYVGKTVKITTATVVHEGRLLSVQGDQVEIRKRLSGGSVTMTVDKSKIIQAKVYL